MKALPKDECNGYSTNGTLFKDIKFWVLIVSVIGQAAVLVWRVSVLSESQARQEVVLHQIELKVERATVEREGINRRLDRLEAKLN
jgi:hypothetical protein